MKIFLFAPLFFFGLPLLTSSATTPGCTMLAQAISPDRICASAANVSSPAPAAARKHALPGYLFM